MILILQMARPKLLEVESHTQFPGYIHDVSVFTQRTLHCAISTPHSTIWLLEALPPTPGSLVRVHSLLVLP